MSLLLVSCEINEILMKRLPKVVDDLFTIYEKVSCVLAKHFVLSEVKNLFLSFYDKKE